MLSRIYQLVADVPEILRQYEEAWVLGTRIAIGIFFCISGGKKLFVAGKRQIMAQTLNEAGIPFPKLNATAVSVIEFVFGGLLILGFLTPLCTLMLAGVMIVALATNRVRSIQAESPLAWLDDFFYLPEVLYVLILIWIFLRRPGRFSLDAFFTSQLWARRGEP